MIGPPGTGKTMSAKALPGILPTFPQEEALEVTRIFSTARKRMTQRLHTYELLNKPNSHLSGRELDRVAVIDAPAQAMIRP